MSEGAFGERASSLSVVPRGAPAAYNRQVKPDTPIGVRQYVPALTIM
jgi:hypothetical protein